LLREQYARWASPPGGLAAAVEALTQAAQAGVAVEAVLEHYTSRQHLAQAYVEALSALLLARRVMMTLQFAPFHLLATEGAVHTDKESRLASGHAGGDLRCGRGLLRATSSTLVELGDAASQHRATAWWEHLTAQGGEGMGGETPRLCLHGRRGLVTAGAQMSRTEYLRDHLRAGVHGARALARLRARGLARKRTWRGKNLCWAWKGCGALSSMSRCARVHECVCGVLALESEPVDPRPVMARTLGRVASRVLPLAGYGTDAGRTSIPQREHNAREGGTHATTRYPCALCSVSGIRAGSP